MFAQWECDTYWEGCCRRFTEEGCRQSNRVSHPPVPRVLSREQGFGELKSRAPPPPGVRDPRSTVPQLVARGEAGEDGTGKEKKAFLGKGETVQAVQGFHAWSRGAWSEAISARVKGLGGPGNGFSRSHGHAWGTDGLGWAVHSW